MKYFLDIQIEPGCHYLHVTCTITGSKCHSYYLNEGFAILSAKSKGHDIAFYMDNSGTRPVFDTVSRPLTFDPCEDLTFEYEGHISNVISGVNYIKDGYIELALYCGWFPKPLDINDLFDFELKISLPDGYLIASNGEQRSDGRIVSPHPTNDIAIFASNRVERCEYPMGDTRAVFFCPHEMLPGAEARAADLSAAYDIFSCAYGPLLDTSEEIVTVFRPFGGWGYKRGKVSFMPAETEIKQRFFKSDFHELAHGWWCLGDFISGDWINEAGAEFSAYWAAMLIYGNEKASEYLSQYLNHISACTSYTPITETGPSSPDRHVNLYEKTAVMLIKAAELFGEARLFDLLRETYLRFKDTKSADTMGFLALCPADMRAFFELCLFSKGWKEVLPRLF